MKATDIENPAWDYIESKGLWLPKGDRSLLGGDLQRWPHPMPKDWVDHRRRVTARWAWAVPAPQSIQFIVDALDGRPLVEVGAGNGYWAWMLDQMGVNVIAYDRAPVNYKHTWFKLTNGVTWGQEVWEADVQAEEFFPVKKAGTKVLLDVDPERVLFLSWPNYNTDFAYKALTRFQGDTLIFLGEGAGGCTGDDKFHRLLGYEPWRDEDEEALEGIAEWKYDQEQSLIQWEGIHDAIFIYRRIS